VSALNGRLAVVSGASRGIGLAIATALTEGGARVVRVARSLAPGTHGGFLDYPVDITDPDAVGVMARRVLADAGPPAILVNNAGVFDRMPFESAPAAELVRQLQVNLVGAFALTQAFLPAMRQAKDGLVVTIGSIADQTAFPENSVYSASKFGLRGLHETLAVEYRGSGVRFTLLSPGPTDTPIWDNLAGTKPVRPRHEMLTSRDVAEAVVFVATRPKRVTIDVLRLTPT
jgi:NAD(P)-dependent dehydrogenase (short-subunit alcohol dehydrogenase family)